MITRDKGWSASRLPEHAAYVKEHGDIDYVTLDKVDRFARNRRDDANILFELRTAGAQLISVKENIDETPAGQLLHRPPTTPHHLFTAVPNGRRGRRGGAVLPNRATTRSLQETIRHGLRTELDNQERRTAPEIAYASDRVTELDAERGRLARGVVTGAIPDDLAREEQTRIAGELVQAQRVLDTAEVIYTKIENTLSKALAPRRPVRRGLPPRRTPGPAAGQPVFLREAARLRR